MTFLISSIIAIVPIAFATIMEHIGDMCAISSTVGKDFLARPGLHRTLTGDGLATALASAFGAPANTTYGENTGVLNLTRVFDPAVIRLATCLSILLSFCPKFACLIGLMPAATIGGVSLILYGMISSVGVRNLVESHVDLSSSRNVFVAALILVLAIGVKYGANDSVAIGSIHLSGLAVAAIVGIVLNAVLPERIGVEVMSITKSEEEAEKAKAGALAIFGGSGDSSNMPTVEIEDADFRDGYVDIQTLLVKAGLCQSRGDARRNVEQGGVTANDEKATLDTKFTKDDFGDGIVIRRGKKNFKKAVLK